MALDVWIALVALFFVGGLTPGPAVMLVLASAFRYGFKPALLPAMGVASANVLWLLLAAAGTATLAAQYPAAFFGLKVFGLLVIGYMALSVIFGPLPTMTVSANDAPKRSRLYAKGVLLQLSSPMPLVYFGLLLPQYFDVARPLSTQLLIMFVTVTITELVGLAAYAYGAERIRAYLRSPQAARIFNVLIGVVMIASGIWAVLSTT